MLLGITNRLYIFLYYKEVFKSIECYAWLILWVVWVYKIIKFDGYKMINLLYSIEWVIMGCNMIR